MDARAATFRRFRALVLVAIAFSLLMKVPTLVFVHDEPDERVYWSLATNLLEHGRYSLQGTPILAEVSPAIYDHPLFHHPPLYPLLLVPFVAMGSPAAAVTISWLGHALCILAAAVMGWTAWVRRGGAPDALLPWAVLPLLAVAVDPLLAFASRKLWIDPLLAGLVAISIALVVLAVSDASRHRRWLLAGGFALGLAGLAKIPGLLAAAIGLWILARAEGTRGERARMALLYLAPAVALVAPWVGLFWATYGRLTPDWLRPDAWNAASYRFIAHAVSLPWYYYAVKLCIAQPLVPLFVGLQLRGGNDRVPLVWFALFLGVATLQGLGGYGYQMRYVAPLVPAVYAGLLAGPPPGGRSPGILRSALLLAVVLYAAMGGAMYLLDSRYDELLTVPELMGVLKF